MRHALPEPYPNELAYGTLARLARIRGYLPRTCQSRHVARYSCQIAPISIALLAGVIDQCHYPDAKQVLSHFLEHHTVLPYVRATRPPSIATDLSRLATTLDLEQLGTRFVRAFYGMSGKMGRTATFRFCDECARSDTTLVGEPWWHLVHFLPNTIVCETHNLWLRHVAHDGLRFVAGPTDLDLSELTPVGLSTRPPKAFRELAALDRAVLEVGQQRLMFAEALYVQCDQHLAQPSKYGLRPAESLTQALRERLGEHVHALSALTGRRLPDYALRHALREVRTGKLSARATVLLAYVFGVDAAQLPDIARVAGPMQPLTLCGARACSAYRVDWSLVLSRSVNSDVRTARAACARCGFSATLAFGDPHPRIWRYGTTTTSLLRELAAYGITSPRDVSVATGLSVRAAQMWQGAESARSKRALQKV
ncbi:MAG: TniQ family protein [Gemmatimonadaceae bacterium]|nr:TniQ family protein [Gemmatimonadaceae bacterium]